MSTDKFERALELVCEIERLLEHEAHPKARIAEAMVCALKQELEGLVRREPSSSGPSRLSQSA